jgi:hypothetical protein
MKPNISEKVMAVAVHLAAGDAKKANRWYFDYPLPEFDGQTASAVVANGREEDVLRLLDMYDSGASG